MSRIILRPTITSNTTQMKFRANARFKLVFEIMSVQREKIHAVPEEYEKLSNIYYLIYLSNIQMSDIG